MTSPSLNNHECSHLHGRLGDICRGDVDLPLEKINQYRTKWGLPPLTNRSSDKPLTLWRRVKSVAYVAAKTAQSLVTKGKVYASQEVIDQRLEVCKNCSYYSQEKCLMCGCSCKTKQAFRNKLAYEASECPIGKWGQV